MNTAGTIGIGHIGIGNMARLRLDRFLTRDDVRSVIAWSRTEEKRADYVTLCGGDGTPDWRDVVDHPDVHAVCVATPTNSHFQYAMAVLEAGKHVLVECPAVADAGEWDQLADTARSLGVVLYSGSNYRFEDVFQAYAYAATKIGPILRAQSDSSWQPEETSWYYDRATSGGVFPCAHIYQFTLFHILGKPVSVNAFLSDHGKYGVAQVTYHEGATGIATGGFRRQGTNEALLVGHGGILRREADGRFVVDREDEQETIPIRQVIPEIEDNDCFIRCIRGEEGWESHAVRERSAHAVAAAAQESAEKNKSISPG